MNNMSKKITTGLRGMARLYAVQTMYSIEITKLPIAQITEEAAKSSEIFVSESITSKEMDMVFFRSIMDLVSENLSHIDSIIVQHLSDKWELCRLDKVICCILRCGVAEILYMHDIPKNVIMNEYIEIAKSFFEKQEVSFVNGLLNAVERPLQA